MKRPIIFKSSSLVFWTVRTFATIMVFVATSLVLFAQEEPAKDLRPARDVFAGNWLIDNQTAIVPIKGTFEMDLIHRFGTVENGYDDYFGLAAPSNIKLGFSYVLLNNLQVGFGITKERMLWDFNLKYVILEQKRQGGFPFNLTYFTSMGVNSTDDEFDEFSDRLSFFHQLMVARKVTNAFTLQVAPSLSWFNYPVYFYDSEGLIDGRLKNNHLAISFLGRVKLSGVTSIIANIDQPLTSHDINDPEGNISLGFEFTSSSHAFQIFIGNFHSISPQFNNLLNQNSFGDGEILIGFNITRLWNF